MEGIEIFDVQGMAVSIRKNEYQDIVSALAELVDNSIEAKAKNIFIILKESLKKNNKFQINDIYVLDDGVGMDVDLLQSCLVFGKSTNKDNHFIGKFGVGLGQASLFAAPVVEVFSWQNESNNSYSVILDTYKMKNGKQKRIEYPKKKNLPKICIDVMNRLQKSKLIQKHGTCIYWKDVDQLSYKKTSTNIEKIQIDLGKKFRYYIDSGINISIVETNYFKETPIYSIDPLFISNNSNFLGYMSSIKTKDMYQYNHAEPLFEPFKYSDIEEPYKIIYKNDNNIICEFSVEIKASVIKEKFYYGQVGLKGTPGKTEIGTKLKEYEGISIMREHREIEFGRFDIYEAVNTPTHRWWGLEINFGEEADDFFNISNNKQHVEIPKLKKLTASNSSKDEAWRRFLCFLSGLIKQMVKRNRYIAEYYKNSSKLKIDDEIIPNFDIIDTTTVHESDFFKKYDIEYHSDNTKKIGMNVISNLQIPFVQYTANNNDNKFIYLQLTNGKHNLIINEQSILFTAIQDEYNNAHNIIELFLLPLSEMLDEELTVNKIRAIDEYIERMNKLELQLRGK